MNINRFFTFLYSKRADDNASVTSSNKHKNMAATAVAFNSDLGAVNIEINPFALVPPHMDDYDHYTKGKNIKNLQEWFDYPFIQTQTVAIIHLSYLPLK